MEIKLGILGQPLGLKKGTTEWYEMKAAICVETGRRRAMPYIDIVDLARYDTYYDKISWFIEKIRKDPKDHRLLQVRCFNCEKWFTPKSKTVSRMIHWVNTGKGHGKKNKIPSDLYCNENCGRDCVIKRHQAIKKYKYDIGEISFSKYYNISKTILYYDWQDDLKKLNKERDKELKIAKRKKIILREKQRKKSLIRKENLLGIYMCNSCSRFLPKEQLKYICKNNTEGECKKCSNTRTLVYHALNRQKVRNIVRKWSKENKDKRAVYRVRRRIKRKEAKDPTANNSSMALIYKYSKMKTKTTGILHEVDHIIPIAKGGKHHENNLQVLIHTKNNIKSDKLDTEIVGPRLKEIKKYYKK